MARRRKHERQRNLKRLLEAEPFLTDEDLAHRLAVSVATIRLDRLEMGVPEMRERTRSLAEKVAPGLVSMRQEEVIGDILQMELGKWGVSVFRTDASMGFAENGIVRGHHLFAQANSLAVAVIDAPGALTASVQLRFRRPVKAGEIITAKAVVIAEEGTRRIVHVTSLVADNLVLEGKFAVWIGAGVDEPSPGEGRE